MSPDPAEKMFFRSPGEEEEYLRQNGLLPVADEKALERARGSHENIGLRWLADMIRGIESGSYDGVLSILTQAIDERMDKLNRYGLTSSERRLSIDAGDEEENDD